MNKTDPTTSKAAQGNQTPQARDDDQDFGAEYETDYSVPALVRQSRQIESGVMSPHDIPESMPVLRAFHEFLDQERRRTQRRMMILAGVCIGLVAMVIVCGIMLVLNYGANARYQYALMERDLADLRDDAGKARSLAESSAGKYADKTDKLKDAIAASQQQLASVQTRTATAAEQFQRDIEVLRRQIEQLQAARNSAPAANPEAEAARKRQDELIRELEKARAELVLARAAAERPAPTPRTDAAGTPPEPVRARTPAAAAPAPSPTIPMAPAPSVVPAPVSIVSTTGTTSVEMPFAPPGTDRPVAWRLPVPNR